MREYLAGQCSFAEHHRRRLRSFLPMLGEPVPKSPGLLDAWIAERYLTVFEESWRCYPDVQPCLETLKRLPRGPRLAVLTNGDPEQQRAKLARFGLLEYFEAVLTPTELGAAKPVAYATACRRMRTDPAQAVNVGDMLESDVNAAALAGLTGIWLDRGEWEALKSKGLHIELNHIFTTSYQQRIRTQEHEEALENIFRQQIGDEDFSKVVGFKRWLSLHPKRRQIRSYMFYDLKNEEE